MSAWTRPTIADFKAYFVRDFNYAPADDPSNQKFVMDGDITKAMDQAEANFNPGLGYAPDSAVSMAFLWLAAFYMVEDLKVSGQGVASQANFPISSKSVQGVSLSYAIPEAYTKDAFISYLASNGYGMKYLSLSLPFTIGRVEVVEGTTTVQ